MVCDPLHHVGDDPPPRIRPGDEVRPVPRARAARLRPQAGPLGGAPPTTDRPGRVRHRLHGHRRQVLAEIHGDGLPDLHHPPTVLLDLHLRLRAVLPLPAPQLRLRLRRLPRRRRHVPRLLHHLMGGLPWPRRRSKRRLLLRAHHGRQLCVPSV